MHNKIYKHDCHACTYIGSEVLHGKHFDFYFCDQGCNIRTVIARHGDEGPEYASCSPNLITSDSMGVLQIAKKRYENYLKENP